MRQLLVCTCLLFPSPGLTVSSKLPTSSSLLAKGRKPVQPDEQKLIQIAEQKDASLVTTLLAYRIAIYAQTQKPETWKT